MSTKLKSGVRTTEFALVVVISLLTQLNVLQVGSDKQKGLITAALAIAYALSRGLAKAFPPKDEAEPLGASSSGEVSEQDVDELPHIPVHPGNVPADEGDAGAA